MIDTCVYNLYLCLSLYLMLSVSLSSVHVGYCTARHIGRRRRAARQPKYLEVMVAVDHSVVEEIGSKEKTQDYIMVLMNIVGNGSIL